MMCLFFKPYSWRQDLNVDFCLLTLLPAFFYLVRCEKLCFAWLINDKAGGKIKPDERKLVYEHSVLLPEFTMLLKIGRFLPS